jgi:hypothetical protein
VSANFVLLAAFACVLLLLLAAAPAYAVARPAQAARIREARPGKVALWWAAALLPWAAVWVTVAVVPSIGFRADTTGETATLAAAGLAAYLLLVALPVAVITATAIWLAERRRQGFGSASSGGGGGSGGPGPRP